MYSSLKTWVCALALIEVLFVFTVTGASNDNCETVIKSFEKKLSIVDADVKAIARALNVGNPPGIKYCLDDAVSSLPFYCRLCGSINCLTEL